MKVINAMELRSHDSTKAPHAHVMARALLSADEGAGFTVTRLLIHSTQEFQDWHEKRRAQSYYCIRGRGILKSSKRQWKIGPGSFYVLTPDEKVTFRATETVALLGILAP